MSRTEPVLSGRTAASIVRALRERVDGYVPGWRPEAGAPGEALLEVFARYIEILGERLDRLPQRSHLSHLDTLAQSLLPAQPARVPLVFQLLEEGAADTELPVDSRFAVPAAPAPASPLTDEEAGTASEPVVFATTQAMVITSARLATVYSVDPGTDAFAEHTAALETGFVLFGDLGPTGHFLYLGHDELFDVTDAATLELSFEFRGVGDVELSIEWEYWSDDGWIPLTVAEDRTEGFRSTGLLRLSKACGPAPAEGTFGERTSYWVRGSVQTALPPAEVNATGSLPVLDVVMAQVSFTEGGLQPDAAYTDAFLLDTSGTFYPFGLEPRRFTTFYIACNEAFQRPGAEVVIDVTLVDAVADNGAELSWEYFTGTQWGSLNVVDNTQNLTGSGDVSFDAPEDWGEGEVGGTTAYWLRVRIDAGSYGEPLQLTVVESGGTVSVTATESTLAPPVVESLEFAYSYSTRSTPIDHCLTQNDFVITDRSTECRWRRSTFEPFAALADERGGVYFGFDGPLPVGLVSLYVRGPAVSVVQDDADSAPPYLWEYYSVAGWTELSVLDETNGFRGSGVIQFVGPSDAAAADGLGGELYRMRARLKRGESVEEQQLGGLWLNAAWATHRDAAEGEELGTADGSSGATLAFGSHAGTVLAGERIEVREWVGTGRSWQTVVADADAGDVRVVNDAVTGEPKELWVRWEERAHFHDSSATDRHYVLDRVALLVRFGDGVHGRIPTAGSRVVSTYDSGGGLTGNVAAGAIEEPNTSIAYLESVTNPVAAEGGAVAETTESALARLPREVGHRGRALAAADYEWIARGASSEVARARCLALEGPAGPRLRGWVTLVVVPYSDDVEPRLSEELSRRVREHVVARCPATVVPRVRVTGPDYTPVEIVAEVVPQEAGEAARVEARLRKALDAFLHPVTGGSEGRGWDFGEAVYLSQVATIVESEVEGVDYAVTLRMRSAGRMYEEFVKPASCGLVAAGDHEIKLALGD